VGEESFKGSLLPILIIASIVAPAILLLSISSGVVGVSRNYSLVWDLTTENYKKGNNIAGGTTSSYTNFNPATHGKEKDGSRDTYLQGGWTQAGDQICTLDIENYKMIYSIYWKIGRTLWGSIDETCYLKVHKIDGWHTIDEHSLGPSEGFEKELEINGQSIDKVQFYGISRQIELQWAQWWVYEIEIYEALPWPPILVSISPSSQEGAPGETLTYTVTVKNLGSENDNYNLTVSDNAGWGLTVSPTSLMVPAGENRTAALSVTILENALHCTEDNILVTATSMENAEVRDNSSCVAHAAIWAGSATFSLENLYKVSLGKDLQLYTGSKLVVKFYTYTGDNQGESVIDNFVPPKTILENENVPHPSGLVPVEKARLVLTTDNTEEVVSTVASFTATKGVLASRYLKIKGEYVKPGADKPALAAEYLEVKSQYIKAP